MSSQTHPNRYGQRLPQVKVVNNPAGHNIHGRGHPSYCPGSLPASNASVVSPNIIMLMVQFRPFIATMKPSYNGFTSEKLVIVNAIRRDTFILLSIIRLTGLRTRIKGRNSNNPHKNHSMSM